MKKLSLLVLLLVISIGSTMAQRTISGTITDVDGVPLIGANVIAVGTAIGTITDIDGSFSLSIPDGTTQVEVSYTGFENMLLDVTNSSNFNVSLAAGQLLDEVVVTALGVERDKKSIGYAQQEVDGSELTVAKDANFINSLSGKVAGVDIKRSTTLDGSSNVIIRGYTSLKGNNQALFVVNGVPINNRITNTRNQQSGRGGYDYGNAASDINPEDVESVSILRGAAATALYGSRAANGVVLITTKKGAKSKGLGISVSTGITAGKIDGSTMPRYQTEYGFGYSNHRGWYGDSTGLAFDYYDFGLGGGEQLAAVVYEDASHGPIFNENQMVYDWRSFFPELDSYGKLFPYVAAQNDPTTFYETAITLNNNIALEGGTDKSTYRLSYTNFDQGGIVPGSKIKKNTISVGASYDFTEKLTVGSNISYVNTNGKGRYGTGYSNRNVNQSFRQWFSPAVDMMDQKSTYEATGLNITWNPYATLDLDRPTAPHYFDNYYWNVHNNFSTDERNRLFGNITLDYKLNDWISIMGRVATDRFDEIREERIAVGSVDVSLYSNYTAVQAEDNMDLIIRFNKYFGNDNSISFNGLLGLNRNRRNFSSKRASTNGGLIVPGLYSLKNSVNNIAAPTENEWERGTNGYFGQLSFGFNNFIYVDLAGRYDVSSTLPKGNNGYFYPSASVSMIFAENNSTSFFNFGKLRLNYAEVGNDAPVLSLRPTYNQNPAFGGSPLASTPATQNNANLLPEKTKSYEIGTDLRFFQNRVNLDISYYYSKSINQIMDVATSSASGSLRQFVNAGRIDNKGLELSLSFSPIRTRSFTWDMRFNWAKNKNKVVELYQDVENIEISTAQGGISFNATKGQPYGTIWGTNYVYADNGEYLVREIFEGGGYHLQRTDAPEVIGDINPDWRGGIWNGFKFGGVSVNFLIDIQKGGDFFSLDNYYGFATGIYDISAGLNDKGNPVRRPVAEGGGIAIGGYHQKVDANGELMFTEDGTPIAGEANTEYGYAQDFFTFEGYWRSPNAKFIYDASFVKLRELSITFDLPRSIFSSNIFRGASLSIIGRNLWIIHSNSPYSDPEAGLSAGTYQLGNQSGAYPAVREFGVNLNFQF